MWEWKHCRTHALWCMAFLIWFSTVLSLCVDWADYKVVHVCFPIMPLRTLYWINLWMEPIYLSHLTVFRFVEFFFFKERIITNVLYMCVVVYDYYLGQFLLHCLLTLTWLGVTRFALFLYLCFLSLSLFPSLSVFARLMTKSFLSNSGPMVYRRPPPLLFLCDNLCKYATGLYTVF